MKTHWAGSDASPAFYGDNMSDYDAPPEHEKRNNAVMVLLGSHLQGDVHEIIDSSDTRLIIKLSDNNTMFRPSSLVSFENTIKAHFQDKAGNIRFYSDHGKWIMETYFYDKE